MNASTVTLDELVGKRVRSLMDFSGIATGTEGVVVEHYGKGERHQGIMVEWPLSSGTLVRDGFGRDDGFDETQWLEVL